MYFFFSRGLRLDSSQAGLFSAAVTAFIIESYKLLQPDNTQQYVAAAMYALLVASNDAAALALVPPPPSPSPAASLVPRWINGLWFTSLFLSLATALLCILVKQWLDGYTARTRASSMNPRHWARRHVFYVQGIDAWSVPAIISILPVFLHAALFLFLAGVGVLLWTLDRVIAGWIVGLTGLLLVVYVVCTVLPFWDPACPFSTPLVNQMWTAVVWCRIIVLRVLIAAHRFSSSSATTVAHAISISPLQRSLAYLEREKTLNPFDRILNPGPKAHGGKAASQHVFADTADSAVLQWLITSVSDSDANAVGLQALGAVHPDSALAKRMRNADIITLTTYDKIATRTTAVTWGPVEVARVVRCLLCMRGGDMAEEHFGLDIPSSMLDVLQGTDYPDMALLWAASRRFMLINDDILDRIDVLTASSTSTAVLLLHLKNLQDVHATHFLLSSKLRSLVETDWKCVFAALRWNGAPPCPRKHAKGTCGERCLPETIAWLLLRSRRNLEYFERFDTAVPLIPRILKWLYIWTDTQLSHLPSFVDYMTSDLFLDPVFGEHALYGLSTLFGNLDAWDFRDSKAAHHAFRALAYLIHVVCKTKNWTSMHPTILVDEFLSGAVPFLAHDLADGHRGWGEENFPLKSSSLVMPLHDILRPTGPSIGIVWKQLFQMSDMKLGDDPLLSLANIIAFALCALDRRGNDSEDMVETFFSQLSVVDLLRREHYRVSLDMEPMEALLPLFQHCKELRPWWWRSGMAALIEENDQPLTDFALQMETQLELLGSCRICPAPEQRSLCSFSVTP